MKKLITLLTLLSFFAAFAASASELTAIELQQYCTEVDKGAVGGQFDKDLANQCKGYMDGFFDSMVILEKIGNKHEFCIPRALPKTQNTMLLNAWIAKNKEIAGKTTAAVALYAALKSAFPCN